MTFPAILLLACALSMDAMAVAAARGMAARKLLFRHILTVALFFGGFQALMQLIGWLVGRRLGPLVEAWDHWIAFVLLVGIGAKMIWEAFQTPPPDCVRSEKEVFGLRIMLLLAIATSIDALAAGIALPLLDAPILLSIVTIGVTTAVLSVVGVFAGRRFGGVLGKKFDAAGGIVLVGIGIEILLRHVMEG